MMGQKRKQEREDSEEIEINYKFKKFRVSSPIDSFDEGDIAPPSPSNFSNFVAHILIKSKWPTTAGLTYYNS